MSERYEHLPIERKWQKIWDDTHCFEAKDDFTKPKYYALIEFPFPSGAGLHVGHPRSNTALDIISRKRRMEGYNVLFPIGYDSFGLPTENYAIKTGEHPAKVTERNMRVFHNQLKMLGFSFDYSREIYTSDPAYYRWTQWIFLKLFEKGLAYKAELPINFCPSCKVGLANEEVVDGNCERCGSPVVRKVRSQWMLRITEYADRLIDDLDTVDFIDRVKSSQKNWIGRSIGAEVTFKIEGYPEGLRIFTTRPDTLFGATYMVVAPEHPIVNAMADKITNMEAVNAYREQAAHKSDFERSELAKEKTGVPLEGITAINPATGNPIPVWISDYVLMGYGTGAIMAVPAHDTRDYAFAKKMGLPIVEVVSGGNIENEAFTDCENGILVNSGFLNGMQVADAKNAMIHWLEEEGIGKKKTNFKLRDWLFSRQRYWGEPIPLVHCDHCGWVPVPEDELPLKLPELDDFRPAEDGSSALARATEWIHTTCPKCGAPAEREIDTMPNWAGSSWYYIRYCDPHNDTAIADKAKLDYWLPVDWYNGGMEHTTLHLLYSRFWHKFLYDLGLVPTKEPYQRRTSHGMILAENGEKMSKSRGNVINPDDIIAAYGADTFRLYEMFIGPFDQVAMWSDESLMGVYRFVSKVYGLFAKVDSAEKASADDLRAMHKCILEVTERIDQMKFNTAVSSMMTYVNYLSAKTKIAPELYSTLIKLLSPFTPHLAEEMWARLGNTTLVIAETWPQGDAKLAEDQVVTYAVQLCGKMRGTIEMPKDAGKEEIQAQAMALENVKRQIEGKEIVKVIVVPNRLINIVVKG